MRAGGESSVNGKCHKELAALSDETARAILKESARLPEREKMIVLGIVRQFAGQSDVLDAPRSLGP
jgi:hypothetical protein